MSIPNQSNTRKDLDKFFASPNEQSGIVKHVTPNTVPALISPNSKTGPGGQLGLGINAPALDVATPLIFNPTVVVVMSVPAMYSGTVMGTLIKNLIETYAKNIQGIDVEYTLNAETGPIVGHDGQTHSVPTKTIRSAQTPTMTIQELSGNIVYETITKWIWDISHPDVYQSAAGVAFPGAWTMSAYAASLLAIQFDPTMIPDRILAAAFISNLYPTTIGSLGLERSLGNVKAPERQVTFGTAIVQHNPYIRRMAVRVAEKLQLHKHNYDYAPPTFGDDPTADIRQLGLAQESTDRSTWR